MFNPISILLVDDHEVVRKGVRAYLETIQDFNVVGEASSGEEAILMVAEHIPDVVLMDLIMPGMDGIETTRQIKKISPRTQVVVLTSYHEDVHIFPALKAGAISYILKDMKMDKLVDALHRSPRQVALEGGIYLIAELDASDIVDRGSGAVEVSALRDGIVEHCARGHISSIAYIGGSSKDLRRIQFGDDIPYLEREIGPEEEH